MIPSIANRRNFLRFLVGSPFFAKAYAEEQFKIASPKDVLAVMDLEEVAHRMLPPAHWGYMSTGVDDNRTLQANIGAFQHIQLKTHKLVDVSKVDTTVEIFGQTFAS